MGHTTEGGAEGERPKSYPTGLGQLGLEAGIEGHTLACSQNCSRLIRFISTAASVF